MDVSLLGTGLMGYPMVKRLLENGHKVTAYNRTLSKALPLKDHGARVTGSPEEAFSSADCVILMLTDAAAIEETIFALPENNFSGKSILQMGTIAPEESIDFRDRITSMGGSYLEAPVLGNKHHAAKGELILMVGSTPEQFDQWKKFFQVFGESTYLAGEVGAAAAMKLALNQLIASLTASFGLSLKFIQKNNGDLDLFMHILRESALYAPQFDKKLSNFISQDYSDPNFPTTHLLKDVDLMIRASDASGLETAALDGVRRIIRHAIDRGYDSVDYSSLVEGIVLEK